MSDPSEEQKRLRTLAFDAGWEACEKFNEPVLRALCAGVWDDGFTEAVHQHTIQMIDPSHAFRRDNPHEETK